MEFIKSNGSVECSLIWSLLRNCIFHYPLICSSGSNFRLQRFYCECYLLKYIAPKMLFFTFLAVFSFFTSCFLSVHFSLGKAFRGLNRVQYSWRSLDHCKYLLLEYCNFHTSAIACCSYVMFVFSRDEFYFITIYSPHILTLNLSLIHLHLLSFRNILPCQNWFVHFLKNILSNSSFYQLLFLLTRGRKDRCCSS